MCALCISIFSRAFTEVMQSFFSVVMYQEAVGSNQRMQHVMFVNTPSIVVTSLVMSAYIFPANAFLVSYVYSRSICHYH